MNLAQYGIPMDGTGILHPHQPYAIVTEGVERMRITADGTWLIGSGILRDSTDGIHPLLSNEYLSKKTIREYMGMDHIDFDAFDREINELQEDFAALEAANGDFNIAFGSPTFTSPCFQAPVQSLDELDELDANIGDVIYVEDQMMSYILGDMNKWLSFGTSQPVVITTPLYTSKFEFDCEIQEAANKVSLAEMDERLLASLFHPTMVDAPPSKKILSSRSEDQSQAYDGYCTREFTQNLRRGKKTLSSRA
jgi:hypothetical protein